MATDPYDDILDKAKKLSPEQQNKLVGEERLMGWVEDLHGKTGGLDTAPRISRR
ncbi:MAG: hypothetical protein GXP26_17005 [Planctomycetes bacterium]|nr:hypothetical protein [Planctomycetota bacterium]